MKNIKPFIALLALFASMPACGSETAEEDAPQLLERRRDTCELRCELLFVPECGAIENPFEDVTACTEECMSPDAGNWALQDDDTDACADEYAQLYECAAMATCDEQFIIHNNPALIAETPCATKLEDLFECNRVNDN